ncbi:MAG TPA: response regulator transcription factor [Paralcaligenes sp.]
MIEIVVIGPQPLRRLGIARVLSAISGARIEEADARFATQETCVGRKVDLAVISVSPATDLAEVMRALRDRYSPKSVLLLSDAAAASYCTPYHPNISGCIPKSSTSAVLIASVRLILSGGLCFSAPIPAAALQPPALGPANGEASLLRLTEGQYEVLVLLARGYPVKTVSRQLNIPIAAGKAHARSLYQRLNAHGKTEALRAAVSRGAKLGRIPD